MKFKKIKNFLTSPERTHHRIILTLIIVLLAVISFGAFFKLQNTTPPTVETTSSVNDTILVNGKPAVTSSDEVPSDVPSQAFDPEGDVPNMKYELKPTVRQINGIDIIIKEDGKNAILKFPIGLKAGDIFAISPCEQYPLGISGKVKSIADGGMELTYTAASLNELYNNSFVSSNTDKKEKLEERN